MRPRAAIHPRQGFSEEPLTGGRQGFKEAGSRDPTDRAQVAELVDALASGASGLTAVKVRVLSWAPSSGGVAQTLGRCPPDDGVGPFPRAHPLAHARQYLLRRKQTLYSEG